MTSISIRDRNTQRHGEESNVKTEAEPGVMWPQAKEYQEPSEAGRGKEEPRSRAF